MSGLKLSDPGIAAVSSLSLTDLFYTVQSAGVGGKRATLAQLKTLLESSFLGLSGTAADSSKLGGTAAASYLLSATAASTYLSLTGGALSGALRVHGSTNTVAVGSTTTPASNAALSFFDGYPSISISSDGDYSGGVISYVAHPTNANVAGGMFAMKSRGTTGAPSAVQSGDNLGAFEVDAWAGDVPQFIVAGDIRVLASENWDDTHWGSHLLVRLNPPGSSNLTEVLRLDGSGALSLVGNLTAPQLALTGDVSAAAWTTNGLKLKGGGSTLTDTSSSGTVALQVTDKLGGNTIAASNATTFTDYATLYLDVPAAGTNVTITNPWSLIAAGALKSTALTLTGGALTLNGATSGASVLSAPAVAGSATITLPGVTATLATLAANTFSAGQTITSGTITASAPALDATQTWNNSGVTFTGLKLNVTNSASNGSSKLLDLQIAGTSSLYYGINESLFSKNGFGIGHGANGWYQSDGIRIRGDAYFGFVAGTNATVSADTQLYRDAAGILAQRNGANAQQTNIYASYTDASNYSRVSIYSAITTKFGGTGVRIAAEKAGSGSQGHFEFWTPTGSNIVFSPQDTAVFGVNNTAFYAQTNATIDIGVTGGYRFRTLLLGQALTGSQATGAIDVSTTWNTSGTPNLINIAVTDTASNAASMLIKAVVGSATVFGVDKAGKPTFGTHSALAAETVSGYITIVDAGGTTRKLAVVS